MYQHPKGWAWLCKIERDQLGTWTPQPAWFTTDGRAYSVPLGRPVGPTPRLDNRPQAADGQEAAS